MQLAMLQRLVRHPGLRFGVRGLAEEARTESLQCSKSTNVGKLAGAISARVRAGGGCLVDGVGPAATYAAMKSINVAGDYIKQEMPGKVLAMHAQLAELPPRTAPSGRETATMMLRLQVAAVMPPQFEDPDPEPVYMSADTNPGVAAGLMSRIVESKGVLPVACMGAEPMSKAIKAIMITESYLQKNKTLNMNVLAFTVQKDWFKENQEDRSRFLLRAFLLPETELRKI
mmetsp:Transcript_57173/g.127544  ORF Transcript_57173/g.127544 Transcript_57173/m.127544 type:complete len:229 (-) Transcript_57173:35-721(-)